MSHRPYGVLLLLHFWKPELLQDSAKGRPLAFGMGQVARPSG